MVGTKKTLMRKPDLLLWTLAVLAVLSLVGFGAYYYYDRYVHADEKVLDRQASQVEEMVKKNPQNADLRVGAAAFYLDSGLVEQAIVQAQEALKIKEDYPGALLVLGRAYKQKGDLASALKNYTRFIELQKTSPMAGLDNNLEAAYYEVGRIYYGESKYPEAISALQAALKIDDTDADAHYSLGMVYQQQKDHASAVKELEQALRFDPIYGPPYQGLVVSYTALGKTAEASYAQAMVALTQGKYADAAAQLESLTKQSPQMTRAYFGLGLAYEKVGKLDQAVAALQKFVQANPNDIAGQNALAGVIKESKR